MSRVARWIVAGYPAAWRERYGEEIEALIDDSGGGWRTALDVLGGGVKMHFRGRNFLAIAAVLGLAGAVAGLGSSYLVAPEYRSTARLELRAKRLAVGVGHERMLDKVSELEQMIRSRSVLSSVMQSPRLDLYRPERMKEPLELVIRRMSQALDLQVDGFGADSMFLKIAFRYRDRYASQMVLQEVATQFVYNLSRSEKSAGRSGGLAATMSIVRYPGLPQAPEWMDRKPFVFGGFVAGVLVALLLTLWFRKPGPTAPMVTG